MVEAIRISIEVNNNPIKKEIYLPEKLHGQLFKDGIRRFGLFWCVC